MINKLWYIQTTECYLAVEGNELSNYEKTSRKLKCILLSERRQSKKSTYCMHPTKGKTMQTVRRLVDVSFRGRER